MKNTRISLLLAIMLIALLGCTDMTREQQGTLSGAGIGAAAGAGIAGLSGGSGWTGAAIGAVAGGVAGNIKARNEATAR
jgi:osmotically inducible lipoprotein OsmB